MGEVSRTAGKHAPLRRLRVAAQRLTTDNFSNKNTLVAEVRHEGIVDVRSGQSGRWGQSQFFGLTNHHHLSVLVLNRRFQVPSFHSNVD